MSSGKVIQHILSTYKSGFFIINYGIYLLLYKETALVCLLPKISKTIKPIVLNFFIRFLITPGVTEAT